MPRAWPRDSGGDPANPPPEEDDDDERHPPPAPRSPPRASPTVRDRRERPRRRPRPRPSPSCGSPSESPSCGPSSTSSSRWASAPACDRGRSRSDRFGPDAAWINGGSPTEGFLTFGVPADNPFKGFFNSIAGTAWVDWLFMLGLLGIGVTLLLGVGMRIGTAAGALMYAFMYAASLPLANNPVVDDHLIGVIAMAVLALGAAGTTWGLGHWWNRTDAGTEVPRPAVTPVPHRTRRLPRRRVLWRAGGSRPDAHDRGASTSAQRDPPHERRCRARRPGRPRASRRGRRRVAGRCAARSRRPPRGRPTPSSATRSSSSVTGHDDVDLGAVGERVPGDVGDRLAQHGQQLVAERVRTRRCRPGRRCARPGVNPSTGTYSLTSLRISARRESPRRSWSSKIVPRIALIVSSRSATAWSSRSRDRAAAGHRRDALQLQAGGEEPLDDDVVEVAGDALAVGDHRQLLAVGERLGAVQGQRRLVGEAGQQLALLDVEQARAGVERPRRGR